MKRKIITAIALLLTAAILSSCSLLTESFRYLKAVLLNDEFGLHILVPYDDMEYERPDVKSLTDRIEKAKKLVSDESSDKDEVLEAVSEIANEFYEHFSTMSNLAYIEYCKDITSEKWRNEYFAISEEINMASAKLTELYSICSKSPYRAYLEEQYFGSDFFSKYDGKTIEYDEYYLSLLSSENNLKKAYGSAMSELSVEYEGKTYKYEELSKITDPAIYNAVVTSMCEKYNKEMGSIYVDLVKTRRLIASENGYDNYAEYAYSMTYMREYSPNDVEKYINGIKNILAPNFASSLTRDNLKNIYKDISETTDDKTVENVGEILSQMIGDVSDVYKSMNEKKLFTFGTSDNMYYGSYELYLSEYDSPYLFVHGNGTTDDILTLTHEFGHYLSSYINYGVTKTNDEAEVASQGLELLCLPYLENVIGKEQAEVLDKYEKYNIMSSLIMCALYTDFENRVYSDEDITLEKCNKYYADTCKDYGIESDNVQLLEWVFTNHFFEQPYYMIGYTISADAAIQLAELDRNVKGDGTKKYLEFIKLANDEGTYFEHLNKCGLENPFSDGRIESVAAFFSNN